MSGTATVEFKLRDARATIWVKGFVSLTDAVTFANNLADYTNAGITRVGFTTSQDLNTTPGTDDLQDMNAYAVCFFRDEDDNMVKLVFPSPKLSLFEVVNTRYSLKGVNGEAIGTILGMMTGHQLTFRHGGLSTR